MKDVIIDSVDLALDGTSDQTEWQLCDVDGRVIGSATLDRSSGRAVLIVGDPDARSRLLGQLERSRAHSLGAMLHAHDFICIDDPIIEEPRDWLTPEFRAQLRDYVGMMEYKPEPVLLPYKPGPMFGPHGVVNRKARRAAEKKARK